MNMRAIAVLLLWLPGLVAGLRAEGATAADPSTAGGPVVEMTGQAAAAKPLPGVALAESISTTTGLAISPLFGMGAVGAWHWWHTPAAARVSAPWYARPWFWGAALAIVLLLVLKEPVLYFLPGAKKPLDLLEVVENKASALLAAPMVVHLAVKIFNDAEAAGAGAGKVVLAGMDIGSGMLLGLSVLGLLAMFACVWMVAHAINLMILLSPSATFDMLLRALRGSVFGAVAVSAWLHPLFGLVVALLVVGICYLCFGWAWRLVVYGSTVAWDLVVAGKQDDQMVPERVRAFLLRDDSRCGLPRRSRGRLALDATGHLVFRGRAMPWLPVRTLPLEARDGVVVRGLVGPELCSGIPGQAGQVVCSLPPRYQGREEQVATALGVAADPRHPVARGWDGVARWVTEVLNLRVENRSLQ